MQFVEAKHLGCYTVIEVIRLGAYRLKDDNSNVLTNTWNIEQLRRFTPKFGLTAFYSTLAPIKAPQPEHFQPRSLGGSMRVQS